MATEPITSFGDAFSMAARIRETLSSAIFGQEDLIEECICCLIAGGHLLMTGAPGLAKTTLVRVIAQTMQLRFGRVQFTADLLPSDILGSEVLNIDPESGRRSFQFSPGPIFVNLLLADEINRASPRTQSALLEVMQERGVTIGGQRHALRPPFMVLATQNPFESEGTFPLPEAQLDRFLIHALVSYPSEDAELKMLKVHAAGKLAGEKTEASVASDASMTEAGILELQAACARVPIDEALLAVIGELVRSSRPDEPSCPERFRDALWYGAGPRAGLSLISTARALAIIEGEDVVRWRHIRKMAKPVMRHRMRLTPAALQDELTEDKVVDDLLAQLEDKHARLRTV